MHYEKQKNKSAGKRVVVAILLLVLIGGGATAGFLFLNGPGGSLFSGEAATPFIVSGNVKALSLDPPVGEVSEDDMRDYFKQAVLFASENGFNTLIFNGKQGLSVYWRDKIFPAAEAVAAQDSFFNKLDPLAILCEEANARGVQVWLSLDPYSSGNYTSEMSGKALSLAKSGEGYFSPDNAEYQALLIESLSALPQKYPIAGIVLSGLDSFTQNAPDTAGWTAAFGDTVSALHTGLAASAPSVSLSLSFSETGGLITPALASSLLQAATVDYLLPTIEAGTGLSSRIATWADTTGGRTALIAVQPQTERAGVVLFTAANSPAYGGALVGSYPQVTGLGGQLALLTSTLEPTAAALPQGLSIPQTLSVNYPAQSARVTSEAIFIMGTSAPGEALLLDGTEVAGRGMNGAFGVLVELAMGNNSFTFTQGNESFTLQVERYTPTGGGGVPEYPSDATQEAQPGQTVRTTALITSALTDYTDDGSINETFPAGATAVVQSSVETTRYNSENKRTEKTWAYLLTSGDYILAKNCEWVSGGKAAFTGLSVQKDDRGEWLTFEGEGTPAAYVAHDSETAVLSLTFYDTTLTLPDAFQTELVRSATVETNPDGSVSLSLQLAAGSLWGYSLEYEGEATKLYLKKPPILSSVPSKPLTGITVMLDPGHGAGDVGAPGLMGDAGPNEKDINLALAQVISYRLQQLGATVIMTREDDTFPTLEDRLAMQMNQKPDFYLSVHHNSLNPVTDLNGVAGVQAYYYSPYDAPPAANFAQNLMAYIAPTTGRKETAPRWDYYYVTRTTVCPSVLFEYGFVTNPTEFEDLTSIDGLWAAACATAEGILASVPQSTPGIG